MAAWETGAAQLLGVDLQDYVATHRRHGPLHATTGLLGANGHRLTVACPCGVTFRRWITPNEAMQDLNILLPLASTLSRDRSSGWS